MVLRFLPLITLRHKARQEGRMGILMLILLKGLTFILVPFLQAGGMH